jgi:hypothetical protein
MAAFTVNVELPLGRVSAERIERLTRQVAMKGSA